MSKHDVRPDALKLTLAVGIVTQGRPAVLADMLGQIRRQSRAPDRIVVCFSELSDIAEVAGDDGIEFRQRPGGITAKRNEIIELVTGCDVLMFFDDDFLPAAAYLEATMAAFESDPAVMVTTGTVLADGIMGAGLSPSAAQSILSADTYDGRWPGEAPVWNAYGCNMAVRLGPVYDHGLRCDERLPLYGLYEDIDFSRRVGRYGRIVRLAAARGVHLGNSGGRTSGLRLGYSQVANPVYLCRKGSLTWERALVRASRHLVKNVLRSIQPESYIDRRGRMAGNWRAISDALRGRLRPERMLEMNATRR